MPLVQRLQRAIVNAIGGEVPLARLRKKMIILPER
jgi:hypothetical protein